MQVVTSSEDYHKVSVFAWRVQVTKMSKTWVGFIYLSIFPVTETQNFPFHLLSAAICLDKTQTKPEGLRKLVFKVQLLPNLTSVQLVVL